VPELKNDKMKIKPVVGLQAYAFNLSDVELLDSPFKEAMKVDAEYLLKLEPDRLLSQFRSNAGLKPKAERYGGWESAGLAGHSLGHYLSACAMYYAVTQDKQYLDRVNYIVDELEVTQKHRKTGYVGAIPKEDSIWAEVSRGNITARDFYLDGAWSPFYTVHKIMAGLLDAYLYCGNEKALRVETGIADWTGKTIGGLNDSLRWKMLICEYGGMNEVLANTYAITGNKKYLDLSYKFQDHHILDSLAMEVNVLPGKHSNTQIPKVIGVARRYELTNDQKDLRTANFFWKTMVNDYSYVTGGNSNYERLGEPDKLNDELTDNTTETCNTYNMLKLTRHMFAVNANSAYMDYYEKALYNHILASQNHKTGMVCYFVPLRMGTRKFYSDEYHTFTCCLGSGMENHVKYGESIYSRGKDSSLYVNLFIPSKLKWEEKDVTITQRDELPQFAENGKPSGSQTVSLTITCFRSVSFPIKVRHPHWAQSGIEAKVNGKSVDVKEGDDGYLVIEGDWRNGDRIDIAMPMNIYTEAMPDNPHRVALFYGPYLLAGVFGDKEPDPETGVPSIVTTQKDPNTWLAETGDELDFKTSKGTLRSPQWLPNESLSIHLIPFNETENEYYSVYWNYFTPEMWNDQMKKFEEDEKREEEIEKKTIDMLDFGDENSKKLHNFSGEKATTGERHGKKWIRGNWGGEFSFNSRVNPSGRNTLYCIYWGEDNRGRAFDILVDDKELASVDLVIYKGSKFHEITYEIPEEMTKGEQQVKLTFRAKGNNSVGPIYGIRMLKD